MAVRPGDTVKHGGVLATLDCSNPSAVTRAPEMQARAADARDQQRAHDDEIGILPEENGENDDQLEHPSRDSPKFPEEIQNGVALFLGHFVVAMLLPAGAYVRVCEPGVGVLRGAR